jgi:hypothetical protein
VREIDGHDRNRRRNSALTSSGRLHVVGAIQERFNAVTIVASNPGTTSLFFDKGNEAGRSPWRRSQPEEFS